jgi:3-(3-hydroxy-phenyl)propionate hydroxylase
VRLLAEGTRFIGLWVGASAEEAQALNDDIGARLPIAIRALDPNSALARHLGAGAGSVILVRPDAYVAARIDPATPAAIESTLRRALSLEPTS